MAQWENEIVARSKKTVVAWVVNYAATWHAVVFIPGESNLGVIPNTPKDILIRMLQETRQETGLPLRIVEDFDGLAATDSHWDGNETFVAPIPGADWRIPRTRTWRKTLLHRPIE